MPTTLFALSGLAALIGLLAAIGGRGDLRYQVLAYVIILIAAVLFVGGAVIREIRRNR